MNSVLRKFLFVVLVITVSSSNLFAFSKVAARFNVMEFYFNSSQPVGTVDRFGVGAQGVIFEDQFGTTFDIDAEDVYDNSQSFGITYGSLINDRTLTNVGISYTDVKLNKVFVGDLLNQYFKLKMYNLDFNVNRYFYSPVKTSFSPFVGLGLQAGLISASFGDNASESDFIYALALNFGADLTVWKAPDKMAKLNLSSVNSYQIYASDSRPTYMTIGLGLKYYFRP